MPKTPTKVVIDDNTAFYEATKAKKKAMAERIVRMLKKHGHAYMVRGAFHVTIEVNEPRSKNTVTQYFIRVD